MPPYPNGLVGEFQNLSLARLDIYMQKEKSELNQMFLYVSQSTPICN